MTQERLIENIKDALGKVIQETVDYYKKGEKKAAWATVDYNLDTGHIMLVQWPNDNTIDVNWSPASAGYGDLGTLIGTVSADQQLHGRMRFYESNSSCKSHGLFFLT